MNRLVKICGLTEPGNIREVIQLSPDLIGFIFYSGSPRYISDPKSIEFLKHLTAKPLIAGVFVNPTVQEIREINKIVHFDVIQLHGSESPGLCREIRQEGYAVIKAFGIRPGFDFSLTDSYRGCADYFLFDTGSPRLGGTGEQFDWDLLELYLGETPYFLSGGLTPDTRILPGDIRMAGVDLNSRFEISPGIKNIGFLQQFLKHFRND